MPARERNSPTRSTKAAHAAKRIAAAAEAVHAVPADFVLTARAENHMHRHADLDDTIERLVAAAAPGLTST